MFLDEQQQGYATNNNNERLMVYPAKGNGTSVLSPKDW